MSRVFFDRELDTVASFWRIWRRDGVALGFVTHDRDIWFGGILHRAAPGLTPAAVRRTSGFDDDGADVAGALAHDCIRAGDLAAGRYDGARIVIGAVDWITREHAIVYSGTIESVSSDGNTFQAQIASAKAALAMDPVPRTSPTCRARFCGEGCGLSAARFTRRAAIAEASGDRVRFAALDAAPYLMGTLRWLDGPAAGLSATILDGDGDGWCLLDRNPDGVATGARVLLREGCDHTIATCTARFGNAVNFQGEPHLPGTDLLAHYPMPR